MQKRCTKTYCGGVVFLFLNATKRYV